MSDEPQRMPRAEHAKIPERKIRGYLLRDDHPEGGSKADFLKRFGFRDSDWRGLQAALYAHASSARVVREHPNPHGTKYEIAGDLQSSDGRNPEVLTVWIIETGDSSPALVTLNPSRRRLHRDDR